MFTLFGAPRSARRTRSLRIIMDPTFVRFVSFVVKASSQYTRQNPIIYGSPPFFLNVKKNNLPGRFM